MIFHCKYWPHNRTEDRDELDNPLAKFVFLFKRVTWNIRALCWLTVPDGMICKKMEMKMEKKKSLYKLMYIKKWIKIIICKKEALLR